jgi:hypothetical protein
MGNTCDTCTKCCEGWLTGNINGYDIYVGKPCLFIEINKGCGIHNDRPEKPCRAFDCAWITMSDMPEEFKPLNSGVIMHYKKNIINKKLGFWVLTKAPNNPTEQFLSWAISHATSNGENILWHIDNNYHWMGSPEFCKTMELEFQNV